MHRWNRSAATQVDAGAPEPLAVFRHDGIVEGWVPALERRVSDGLNAGEPLRIQTPNDDGTPGSWVDLDFDEVVAVAPSPRPASRSRVSRRLHAVEVQVGPYVVRGVAHLPVGADPARYVGSTSRWWLPLTQCTVASGDDEWEVEVMILNLDHAMRARPAALAT
jgi:hypothetical protein